MIGFAHEVEIEAEGRQEEPQEEKMPKGRTDRASWDGDGNTHVVLILALLLL